MIDTTACIRLSIFWIFEEQKWFNIVFLLHSFDDRIKIHPRAIYNNLYVQSKIIVLKYK